MIKFEDSETMTENLVLLFDSIVYSEPYSL